MGRPVEKGVVFGLEQTISLLAQIDEMFIQYSLSGDENVIESVNSLVAQLNVLFIQGARGIEISELPEKYVYMSTAKH